MSKHQNGKVLVLFFVPCGERNRTIRNKTEQFGLCQNRPLEKPSGHEEHLLPLHCQKQKMQNKMETKIMKVVRQGEAFSVQSQKSESGQIQKCNIVLREMGGSKFENEYACAMLGPLAACRFYEGDVVAATLRFSTHEYQGQVFQDIVATDIVKISK